MLAGSQLTQLVVYVHDLAESSAFYQDRLGLPITGTDDESTTLDAGGIAVCLNRAADYGVTLFGRRDDSSDIVFLTEDLEQTRAELEERGVEFIRRRSYEVGQVTDFYDPNGHRLMLYQPSDVALTWPSAPKIREVWERWGRRGGGTGLAGKPLVYVFMFENEQTTAFDFYRKTLELSILERVHCCNQKCAEEIEGIAKYDGGGVLLATHHVHPAGMVVDDLGRPYSPKDFNPVHGQGIVPVFQVDEFDLVTTGLQDAGVRFTNGIERRPGGSRVRFEDPFGHPYFVAGV